MKSEIFRQKNIDKMSSPEDLNEYVKVTSPSVWIIISAIILILVGALAWAATSKITATVYTAIVSDGEKAICYIDEDLSDSVRSGQTVYIGYDAYILGERLPEPVEFDINNDSYILHILKEDNATRVWTYAYKLDGEKLEEGKYFGTVTVNQIAPISFITN